MPGGDMPLVSTDTLRRLCETTRADGAAACRYPDGRLGSPACFDAALFSKLEQIEGDRGAQSVLNDTDNTIGLPVDPSELYDVDSAEDLLDLNRPRRGF
jgi:molybdenum cofactor cytidylyltransferase